MRPSIVGRIAISNLPQRPNPAIGASSCSASHFGAEVRAGQSVSWSGSLVLGLATLTRNTMKVTTAVTSEFEMLATPTSIQRQVFGLLGAPVPMRLL